MDNRLSHLTAEQFEQLKVADFIRCIGVISARDMTTGTPGEEFRARFPNSAHVDYVQKWMQHKAVVPGATTTNTSWASTLVPNLSTAFAAAALPDSLIGGFGRNGVPALTRVPFDTRIAYTDPIAIGATVAWIHSGGPKPVVAASIAPFTLRRATAAFNTVLTEELARFAEPGSIEFLQQQLSLALGYGVDRLFVDETIAATSSTPASILNGVTAAATSTGDPDADVRALKLAFQAGGGSFSRAVLLISSANASALADRSAATGATAFPGLTATGGRLAGHPCVASDAVGDRLIMVDPTRVLLADDLELNIARAGSATLEMVDNPTTHSGTGTATTSVSMFQTHSQAVRLERFTSWAVTSDAAVQWVDGVDYLTEGSPA